MVPGDACHFAIFASKRYGPAKMFSQVVETMLAYRFSARPLSDLVCVLFCLSLSLPIAPENPRQSQAEGPCDDLGSS